DLHVNSPGGLVFDGVAIYSALRNHPATVDVSIDGLAASAASFVAMAGDSIAIEKPAKMMIHDAAGLVIGNAADMLEMATLLDELSDTIADIYAERAGGTAEQWRQRMRDETWFSAQQAVEAGLADQINNDTAATNTESSPVKDRGKVPAAAWNALPTSGGKDMSIEEILAAMQAIIDGAEGRTLTDSEVKQYEQLENQLAEERTEAVRRRQKQYDSPAPENAQIQAAVHVAPAKPDNTVDQAFEAYMRTGRGNQDISHLAVNFNGQPRMAQETGSDSEGGYLVPEGFRQKLVEVRKAFGGLAAEVDSFSTTSGNDLEYPSLDDTDNEGDITAEEAAVEDGDDLTFGTVSLGAFKYTSAGAGTNQPLRVSVELAQDSAFDIAALVARALATRIQRKQADDWVNGGGTTLPFGILHDGLTADVVLDSEATLTYGELLEVEAALDPAYWQNAQWLMNASTWVSTVKALEDDNKRPLIMGTNDGITGRPMRQLLGYPVVVDQACNDIDQDGADGGFALLGDLREAYTIRRVQDFVLVVDPFSRAVNGQIQYHAWERADGNIQNRSAYATIENITT
ncbi:MAG: phage major capsid protein, partial [Jiangellaceae bacterium]